MSREKKAMCFEAWPGERCEWLPRTTQDLSPESPNFLSLIYLNQLVLFF